jgi:hypothetical protein
MTEYKKQTDEIQEIKLESKITHAFWDNSLAMVGEKVTFQVITHFVGNGSEIQIKVENKKGKSVANAKGEVYGNYFAGSIDVTEKAKEEISFTAKLPKHGLEMKSESARVIPLVEVTNQKWSQKEARRGDVVKLTADVEGLPDETEVMIHICEYDQDGAHDFITKFPCGVKNKKIEAEWEYEYHEDTDEIPTQEEKEKYGKNYNPPEYFFVINYRGQVFGDEQESGLLEFKDWIEIRLRDIYGEAMALEKYILYLADGTKREGKLDDNGHARIENVPAGPCEVEYPNLP